MLFKRKKYKQEELTDAQMILLAQQNHKHFGLLYEKYFEQMFRFVFKRLGGDEENASDITQQVFIKAMGAIGNYEDRGFPFSTWLYRIAQNEVNMYFRKNSRNFTVEVEEKHIITLLEEMECDEKGKDHQEVLVQKLNRLKPEQLDLIELRFFQELSFREIADIYNITEANAKMRIYRIIEKMQQEK
ncbi:RNA polymerase sigma factor [Wandonia haliotis]|uniref:RNA polymerase sigma factor n=1 Tax=Wandonia haliotis TaxID=574963 RepID=A0ABN1MTP5_9FLAO